MKLYNNYLIIKMGFALTCAVIITFCGLLSNISYFNIKCYVFLMTLVIFSPELFLFCYHHIKERLRK